MLTGRRSCNVRWDHDYSCRSCCFTRFELAHELVMGRYSCARMSLGRGVLVLTVPVSHDRVTFVDPAHRLLGSYSMHRGLLQITIKEVFQTLEDRGGQHSEHGSEDADCSARSSAVLERKAGSLRVANDRRGLDSRALGRVGTVRRDEDDRARRRRRGRGSRRLCGLGRVLDSAADRLSDDGSGGSAGLSGVRRVLRTTTGDDGSGSRNDSRLGLGTLTSRRRGGRVLDDGLRGVGCVVRLR